MNLFERACGAAPAETLFSDQALIAAMVRFESELALAQAQLNLIPADAAGAIHRACNAFTGNPAAMADAATLAGTLAVPLVAALRAQVATINPDAARW
ncbi:MAG: 3-carboxy-cis,cis-muconate cycloisomerase, partial [Betaproteobacteria bacterium]|nr:3-carboxy-cis,cis-muconate cycloisomerase [Betaproteobacteria bacterium]